MATEAKKNTNSELTPLNISKLSTLQYIKVIFVDINKEIHEIRTDVQTINNEVIILRYTSDEAVNIAFPIGVALKLITIDAIYFSKAILRDIKQNKDKFIFTLDTPKKTIRQQNRKFYRINIDCPGVILINDKTNPQTYIAQSVNISKGGALLYNIESMLDDEQVKLQLSKGDYCNITLFLEQGLKIKASAKFVRSEFVDNKYRYAFEFINMSKKYIAPFEKYLTNEEFKLLRTIKQR